MQFNRTAHKIPFLIDQQNKNETNLNSKQVQLTNVRSNEEFISSTSVIYDSDWINIEPEDILGAATQIENLELPQKIPFETSFVLEISEAYLPFINISILTTPTENQKVQSVGQFIYSGLQEVLLGLWDWKGTVGITGGFSPPVSPVELFTDGSTLPPLPSPTLTIPPPSGCYYRHAYFSSIYLTPGGGASYPLSEDGTQCYIYPNWYSTYSVIQNWISIWNPLVPGDPDSGKITVRYYFSQSVYFLHPITNFPLPIEGGFTFPCGSNIPPSGYPDQRWEQTNIVTFQEYMVATGKSYAQAVELFSKYYPEIFITPFSHGVPYKCYQVIYQTLVESGTELIKISKINNNKFQFDIYGNLLLVSPAITETDYSDPDFPTYKPDSTPLAVRILATFRDHPVNFIQVKAYKK